MTEVPAVLGHVPAGGPGHEMVTVSLDVSSELAVSTTRQLMLVAGVLGSKSQEPLAGARTAPSRAPSRAEFVTVIQACSPMPKSTMAKSRIRKMGSTRTNSTMLWPLSL